MEETVKVPEHIKYDYYKNGIDHENRIEKVILKQEVNEIIEEIIDIMRKHKVTVHTSKQILEDTISSIERETIIT
ncbi:MAG: hypothetical protein ACLVD1_10205 [Lacrimispora saccharolytica]